jgi:hypothetical protein
MNFTNTRAWQTDILINVRTVPKEMFVCIAGITNPLGNMTGRDGKIIEKGEERGI